MKWRTRSFEVLESLFLSEMSFRLNIRFVSDRVFMVTGCYFERVRTKWRFCCDPDWNFLTNLLILHSYVFHDFFLHIVHFYRVIYIKMTPYRPWDKERCEVYNGKTFWEPLYSISGVSARRTKIWAFRNSNPLSCGNTKHSLLLT